MGASGSRTAESLDEDLGQQKLRESSVVLSLLLSEERGRPAKVWPGDGHTKREGEEGKRGENRPRQRERGRESGNSGRSHGGHDGETGGGPQEGGGPQVRDSEGAK